MSEYNHRNASLQLRTADVQMASSAYNETTSDVSNDIGSISNLGSRVTFKRVDLGLVMGDLLSEYTMFNLRLSSFIWKGITAVNISFTDTVSILHMSGLPWSNQEYSHATRGLSSFTAITAVTSSGNNGLSAVQNINPNICCFSKPTNRFVDITIELRSLSSDQRIPVQIGHFCCVFDIFPILDSKIVK
ncbi:MAG: hypothetical protein EOP48_28735 [Sphingobacteriales bacterium]|nr:MAG: hypothetical protein EOP48_28735 [Sphingobacteriales bacterium]